MDHTHIQSQPVKISRYSCIYTLCLKINDNYDMDVLI